MYYIAWCSHIAGIVIRNCISHARSDGIDPRECIEDIDWTMELSKKDVKKIWAYIALEVIK